MSSKNSNKKCFIDLTELLLAVSLSLMVVKGSTKQLATVSTYLLIFISIAIILFGVTRYKIDFNIVCISAISIVLFYVNGFVNATTHLKYFAMIWVVAFPVALFMLYSEKMTLKLWIGWFWIVYLFLFYKMVNSPDGYLLYYGTSRNYVSIYLIFSFFICAVAFEKNGKEIPIYYPMMIFLLATYAVGRGGIISTFFLLFCFILHKFHKGRNRERINIKILLVIVLILSASVLVAFNVDQILNTFFPRLAGDQTAASNSERMQILITYFEGIKNAPLSKKIFGLDPRTLGGPFIRVEWNIHNSYLQSYSEYGMFAIIIYAILLAGSTVFMKKQGKMELLIVLFAFLLRAGTDFVFPGELGDVVIFYYSFLPFVHTKTDQVICAKQEQSL